MEDAEDYSRTEIAPMLRDTPVLKAIVGDEKAKDVKQAMTHQAQTIERQEIMLSDYARHVGKLERIMAAAQMEIPEFETSHLRGGRNG